MELNTILCGDALSVLQTLPSDSVNCCVTSPPYFGLRNYDVAGQIGLEQTPAEYVLRLTTVFRELRRVLTPDGIFWLNIADSYAAYGQRMDAQTKIKPKDMLGIPWLLAFALRADGWYLRSDVIWNKPNCMPHPVKDRPVSSYEHVFLFAKSQKYRFDYTALEVPMAPASAARYRRGFLSNKYATAKGNVPGQAPQPITLPREGGEAPDKRRGRDVWTIGTNNFRSVHCAAYPVELAKPCILAGCPADGIVIDPFFGTGTTGAAALEFGRNYIGIELNPEFCKIAEERLKDWRNSHAGRQ